MRVRAELAIVLLAFVLPGHLAAQNPTSARARGTASIAGRIINADGSAALSARVVVYAVREGAPAAIVGTTTSSYDGRYEVSGLAAGPVMVGVTSAARGGFGGDVRRPAALPVETLYPGVTDRARAVPVTLFEGVPAEGIDVWLAPAPQRFTIGGRVSWPEGTTVENVTIEYGGADALRRGIWYVHDPGGLFTIEGVAEGTYVLLARGETPGGPLLGLASTDVAIGPVEDVRLVLRSPGSIEGRLTTEGVSSPSLTAFRVTPVQTLLTLSPAFPVENVAVGEDGRFSIPHVNGEYTFAIDGLPSGWRIRRVVHRGAPVPGNRIRVGAGERVTGVEIVIGAGST